MRARPSRVAIQRQYAIAEGFAASIRQAEIPVSGCRFNRLRVARCCPHREAVVKQMSDDPATEKTGSAENRN
jgi:hypothetical protein